MRNSITKKQGFSFKRLAPGMALCLAGTVMSNVCVAQESMAGMSAASGISSSMSGMSSSSSIEGGRRMRGSAAGMGSMDEMGGMPSPDMMGGMGPGAAPPPPAQPRLFGTQRGINYLNELLSARRGMPKIPSPIGRSRSSRGQAALSRRLRNMTSAQRQKLVMQKYDIRPRNWLAHYLKADRYKIASGLWTYMTTRTSRFYYRPWAPAMLKADPNHVIGFRTWHDAILAGYRPDPVSRPEPAPQIVDMARYTKGMGLQRYIEFVYAGQVSTPVFNRNYQYVKRVAGILQRYQHTRPLVGDTVEQVILASIGQGAIPRSVGGPPALPSMLGGPDGGFGGFGGPPGSSSGSSSSSSMMSSSSGGDRRTEDFNNFSNRAGGLANVPANQGSSGSAIN